MIRFPREVLDNILGCFPPLELVPTSVLSNRRNKGQLWVARTRFLVRDLNLEFFNSGQNDGLSSCVVREVALLNGRLARHPHIVPLVSIGSGASPDTIRMVYPFYEYSLRDFIAGQGRAGFPLEVVREVSHQILRGLSYMHAQRVVHRNLKPENILIGTPGGVEILSKDARFTVVIADVGSGRVVPASRDPREPTTPEHSKNRAQTERERIRMVYRAPEVLLRRPYSFPADIWSFGTILGEMLFAPTSLPWTSATSENELLIRVFSIFGTPGSVMCGPNFLKKNRAENEFFQHISDKAPDAAQLLDRLLDPDPAFRVSAEIALASPFVLGVPNPGWGYEEGRSDPPIEQTADLGVLPCQWVQWLFQLLRVLECPTTKPVHACVRMWGKIFASRPETAPLLAACLKMSARFFVSRDMFKQVTCGDIATATGVPAPEVIAAEIWLLSVGILPEFPESPPNRDAKISLLAEYVSDLILLEGRLVKEFPSITLRFTALLVAAQWVGDPDLSENFQLWSTFYPVSLDELQRCAVRCSAIIGETQADPVVRLIEPLYRVGGKSVIPKSVPSSWDFSRKYFSALTGGAPGEYDSNFFSTPGRSSRLSTASCTPAKLVRASTLQHAADWLAVSRRRSRSNMAVSHKRLRLSVTPSQPPSKRAKISAAPLPALSLPQTPQRTRRVIVVPFTTPRRSLRLSQRQSQIN